MMMKNSSYVVPCLLLLFTAVHSVVSRSQERLHVDASHRAIDTQSKGATRARAKKLPKALREAFRKKTKGYKPMSKSKSKGAGKKKKGEETIQHVHDGIDYDSSMQDPTSPPSTVDPCPPLHVCSFYIGYKGPSDSRPDTITDDDIAELRKRTEEYFETYLQQVYFADRPDVKVNDVVLVDSYHAINWELQPNFDFALVVDSAFVDLEGDDLPSQEKLFHILRNSMSTDYILHYVRATTPAFTYVNEVELQAMPTAAPPSDSGGECLPLHACDFFIALAGNDSPVSVTDDDIAELRSLTEDYLESHFRTELGFAVNSVVLVDVEFSDDWGVPASQFELALIVHSAFFDLDANPAPSSEELFYLVRDSVSVEYIMQIRGLSAFPFVNELMIQAMS